MDTLGFVSFTLPSHARTETAPSASPSSIWFTYKYIDANMQSLYAFTGLDADSFHTELGNSITAAVTAAADNLKLSQIIGCPAQDIWGAELYDVYMEQVIPLVLWKQSYTFV